MSTERQILQDLLRSMTRLSESFLQLVSTTQDTLEDLDTPDRPGDGDDQRDPEKVKLLKQLQQALRSGKLDVDAIQQAVSDRWDIEQMSDLDIEALQMTLRWITQGRFDLDDEDDDDDGDYTPPVRPDTGNTLRMMTHVPEGTQLINFMSAREIEGLQSVPVSYGADSQPTAFLVRGVLNSDDIVDDIVDLEDIARPSSVEIPTPVPEIVVDTEDGGTKSRTLMNTTKSINDIIVGVWSRPFSPDGRMIEVEVYLESQKAQYVRHVKFNVPAGWTMVDHNTVLVSSGNGDSSFAWGKGQTTIRRFLLSMHQVTQDEIDRFNSFSHIAVLHGADSYDHGGWGVTQAAMPTLDEESVGWDVTLDRHQNGAETARRIQKHVEKGTFLPGLAKVGPWNPRGNPHGGGTGGDEIHPYSGWARTPGEVAASWWKMRTMGERMITSMVGLSGKYAYEKNLQKYKPHDMAHFSRAMVDAWSLIWNYGSQAAIFYIQRQAVKNSPPSFGEEFNGIGHKWAHRALGWAGTLFSTAFAVSQPASEMRDMAYEKAVDARNAHVEVAMPTGITHRAGTKTGAGKFTAFLNPDPWQLGVLPEGTTAARVIMIALAAQGASSMFFAVFPEDEELRKVIVNSAQNTYFHTLPPRAHLVVGGHDDNDVYEEPYMMLNETSVNVWECQWHLVQAYRASGDISFLLRAVMIQGHGHNLEDAPYKEFQRSGSKTAWWERTVEVIAEIQRKLRVDAQTVDSRAHLYTYASQEFITGFSAGSYTPNVGKADVEEEGEEA